MNIVITGSKGSGKTSLKHHISAEMGIPCVDHPSNLGPWVMETRELHHLPEWAMRFGPLVILHLDREGNPNREDMASDLSAGIRCVLRRKGTTRSMAKALIRYWNSETLSGTLRAVESDVVVEDIAHDVDVIDASYGWTVYADRRMAGLTSGDHGFEETSLKAPEIFSEEYVEDLYTGLQCLRFGTDIVWMEFGKETR